MTDTKKAPAKTPTTKTVPEPDDVSMEEAGNALHAAIMDGPTEPTVAEPTPPRRTVLLGGAAERGIPDSDKYVDERFPLPQPILDMAPEEFGPTSMFVKPVVFDDAGQAIEFEIREERLKGLTFDRVMGRALQKKKRLKVIKALKPDGTMIQLPWERRINNAVVGRDGDQIGMLVYTDKGYMLLQDEQKYPYFCFAIDCFAPAMRSMLKADFPEHKEAIGTGYCSMAHADHTNPNKSAGIFGEAATTSQTWNV